MKKGVRPSSMASAVLFSLAVLLTAFPCGAQSGETAGSAPAESSLAQPFCPVIRDQPALLEHEAAYKGKQVHFCCNDCLREFERNPGQYAAHLPELARLDDAPPARPQDDPEDSSLLGVDFWWELGLLIAAIIAAVLALRYQPGKVARQEAKTGFRVAPLLGAVLAGLAVPLFYFASDFEQMFSAIDKNNIADLHYATFDDFGLPPMPPHPPVERRLQATFYRGNDERHPRLFNGGHYRTTTFYISLRTDDGKAIEYGDDLKDQEISVRLEIERAPNTADFFFEDRTMDAIFATREFGYYLARDEPVPDALPLTVLEKTQRWEVVYPLGPVAQSGPATAAGVIYLCEERHMDRKDYSQAQLLLITGRWWGSEEKPIQGSRFHYAIQYDLHFEQGVIDAESDLWMGSLYRTRKVDLQDLPHSEWFSHEPIPVLPAKTSYDAELLEIESSGEDEFRVSGADRR